MKNVMKAATLESKFPLLAVENGCIVSKEADVTGSPLQGGTARTVLRYGERVRGDPLGLAQGGEGAAGVFHRTHRAGLLSRRSTANGQGRPELPEPELSRGTSTNARSSRTPAICS